MTRSFWAMYVQRAESKNCDRAAQNLVRDRVMVSELAAAESDKFRKERQYSRKTRNPEPPRTV